MAKEKAKKEAASDAPTVPQTQQRKYKISKAMPFHVEGIVFPDSSYPVKLYLLNDDEIDELITRHPEVAAYWDKCE